MIWHLLHKPEDLNSTPKSWIPCKAGVRGLIHKVVFSLHTQAGSYILTHVSYIIQYWHFSKLRAVVLVCRRAFHSFSFFLEIDNSSGLKHSILGLEWQLGGQGNQLCLGTTQILFSPPTLWLSTVRNSSSKGIQHPLLASPGTRLSHSVLTYIQPKHSLIHIKNK